MNEDFRKPLISHSDNRGSFTEFIKTSDRGQISVNVIRPGKVKGNHWHHTKTEKFLILKGEGLIRFRQIETTEIIEYMVSGNKLEVVDVPVGYTHNIENIGVEDLIILIWANELYDENNKDTHPLNV